MNLTNSLQFKLLMKQLMYYYIDRQEKDLNPKEIHVYTTIVRLNTVCHKTVRFYFFFSFIHFENIEYCTVLEIPIIKDAEENK